MSKKNAVFMSKKNVAHAGGVATVGWPVKIRLFRLFFQFSFFPNFYGVFFAGFLVFPGFFWSPNFCLDLNFLQKD
jgi:hypothetical protein